MSRPLLALAAHGAAVVWLTWPLTSHLATHLPMTTYVCHHDPLLVAWALAHVSRTLLTSPWNLADGGIFHPAAHSLFYGEAGFGALPYFMPAFLLTGSPTLALNLVFLGGLASTAWALHRVVVRWSQSEVAGLLAGWTFLSASWAWKTWIPAAPNYAVLAYFPWLLFLASTPCPAVTRNLALLLLLVAQGLSSIYVAAAALGGLALLGVCRTMRRDTRRAGFSLLAVVGVAAAALLVAYSGYLVVRSENPRFAQQTRWKVRTVSSRQLPWDILDAALPTSIPIAAATLIGLAAVSLALGGWQRLTATERAGWRQGIFWTLAGVAMSLPRDTHVFGATVVSPASLFAHIPLYESLREIHRLALGALMGLAVLAGLAFAEITRRVRALLPSTVGVAIAPLLACCVALLFARELLGAPFVGFSERGPDWPEVYPIEVAPRREPILSYLPDSTGPGLEIPATNSRLQAEAIYHAIYHRRRLLNGYSGYWPAGFPERMGLAAKLPDLSALARLRDETGLAWLLVRTGEFGHEQRLVCQVWSRGTHRDPTRCGDDAGKTDREKWLAIAAENGGAFRLLARDGDDLLFDVTNAGEEPAGRSSVQ